MAEAKDRSAAEAKDRVDLVRSHLGKKPQEPVPLAIDLPPPSPKNPYAPELADLEHRRRLVRYIGEDERGVIRQRAAGKLTVRERIEALIDPGSWREFGSTAAPKVTYSPETGKIASFMRANNVVGRALVDNRPVVVSADDFSIRGGHADGAVHRKTQFAEQMSREYRIPMVRMVDGASGGGSAVAMAEHPMAVPAMTRYGLLHSYKMLDEVPVCSIALGPSVGGGAIRMSNAHFSVMAADVGQLFVSGPPIVVQATHENVTKAQLGGAWLQASVGGVDNVGATELESIALVKRFLSYLPSNRWTMPPVTEPGLGPEDPERIRAVIPRDRSKPYNPRDYLEDIVDRGTLFEYGPMWGKEHGCFLGRINGKPVAILASDPRHNAGALGYQGCSKISRFLGIAATFHLPCISFVDCPGFAVGTQSEKAGTLRAATRLGMILYDIRSPVFTVLVRKCYGMAGAILATRGEGNQEREGESGADVRVAWPSIEAGGVPAEGGIDASFKAELEAVPAGAPRDALRKRIETKIKALQNPVRLAESFGVEEMIDPADTREVLGEWLDLTWQFRLPEIVRRDAKIRPGAKAMFSPA
ncbi:carboxyl transferase [Hyaloraphidium curvatum]|nr:carboxyl transferase [Hyaloraphidium curvatum]